MVAGVLRTGSLGGFPLSIAQLTVFIGIKLIHHLSRHSRAVATLLITELTILIGIKLIHHLSRHSRAVATLTTGAFGTTLTTRAMAGTLTFMIFLHFGLHGFFFSIAELTVLIGIKLIHHLSRHSRAVATLTTGAFGITLTTRTMAGTLTFMIFLHFGLHGFFFSIAELTVLVCIKTLQHFLMKILTLCTTGHLAGGPPMAGLLHTGSRCGDFLGHGGFLLGEYRQSA